MGLRPTKCDESSSRSLTVAVRKHNSTPSRTATVRERIFNGADSSRHDTSLPAQELEAHRLASGNVDRQFPKAVAAINRVVNVLDAEVHLHCRHSVYKRKSDATGDYQPIPPRLKDPYVHRLNLELAYQRTGVVTGLALPGIPTCGCV